MASLLIVNGDDFGRSLQVNAGILRAHQRGILTSTSLMVAGAACREAVEAARDCPGLDVGLHVVACNGRSLLGPGRLRGLVDGQGFFPRSEVWAGMRYCSLNPVLRARLRDEFRAQIDRHLAMVGYLNHLDGHHNLHLHPVVADILLPLAAEYRVPYVRRIWEPFFALWELGRSVRVFKLRDDTFFRWLSSRAGRQMNALGLRSNDWTLGFHRTGQLSEEYAVHALERLPVNGATEFYFHPAMEANHQPPHRRSQIREVSILTSSRVRDVLARCGIRLTTYRELAGQKSSPPSRLTPAAN